MMLLPQLFYNQSAIKVAQDLLGCFLVRQFSTPLVRRGQGSYVLPLAKGEIKRGYMKFKIVETEAYNGPFDLASHASRGRTARNQVMFGAPGYIYVYFTYGMHYMLNIVCGAKNYPAAILIRAVQPMPSCHCEERSHRFARSGVAMTISGQLIKTNGPARLTKALKIDKSFNCLPIFTKKHGLWVESGKKIKPSQIVKTTRIGVDYAGIYKNKKWRFYIKGNGFISKK